MLFLLISRLRFSYGNTIFKIFIFLINLIWLFAFLISTTIAFLPIIPTSLFAAIINLIPHDPTKVAVMASIIEIFLFFIFALVGLVSILRILPTLENYPYDISKIRSKKKHIFSFFLALAIPFGLAFALVKALHLTNYTILLLTGTFMFVSYTAMIFVRFNKNIIEELACLILDETDINIIMEKRCWNKFQNNILRGKVLINTIYILYVVIALALTILISLPYLSDQIARLWSSALIYGPAALSVIKILSVFLSVIKKLRNYIQNKNYKKTN